MRRLYGGDERSQKLKYHIQTSGRSLHAQEIGFNDIRTTLQALMAYRQRNSLHTNACNGGDHHADGGIDCVAPSQSSSSSPGVRPRKVDILQESYFIRWLTDRVEGPSSRSFAASQTRGGVLGAIETQYQRSRIQEESLLYEARRTPASCRSWG
jgi:methylmalonyl-CoA mutase